MTTRQARYFSGNTELDIRTVGPIPLARFIALGGVKSKHNRYDSFNRLGGETKGEGAMQMAVTRLVLYKTDHPSLHKCDARCMNATGHDCECSCGGRNHGINSH